MVKELCILLLTIFYLALIKIISDVYITENHTIENANYKYYIIPKNYILRYLYSHDTIIAALISRLLHDKIKWILIDQNDSIIDEGSYEYLFNKEYKLIRQNILNTSLKKEDTKCVG